MVVDSDRLCEEELVGEEPGRRAERGQRARRRGQRGEEVAIGGGREAAQRGDWRCHFLEWWAFLLFDGKISKLYRFIASFYLDFNVFIFYYF